MSKKQFYILLLFVILSITLLAASWEFWLEDIIGRFLSDDFEPESREERWEYVISIAVFASLSLIYPLFIGLHLINRQQQLTQEIIDLSELDHLTEMYNRRKMSELFKREITRSKRYKLPLSIILIDIDHFKDINDRFGHIQGDKTLQEIASIMKAEVRKADYVGRWGGEEFLIICPETDINGAMAFAEKLRTTISGFSFTRVGHKTASFGVTSFEADLSAETMLGRADKALYTAKSAGRNSVEKYT